MTLAILIGLAVIVAYFSLRSSNILLGLAAAIPWIMIIIYTRSHPIAGMTTGSFGDELLLYLCWIFAILLPLLAITRSRREKQYFGDNGGSVEWGESREIKQGERRPKVSDMDADLAAYRNRVQKALHRKA
jgi:uncharacterized membrane protein